MAKDRISDEKIKERVKRIIALGIPYIDAEHAYIGKGVYLPILDIDTIDDEAFEDTMNHVDEDDHSMDYQQPSTSDPQQVIEGEVINALSLQKSLENMQNELMQNEKFRQFLELSKTVPKQIDETWARIEKAMIENNIKSLKGDYGSITIVERIGWDYDPTILSSEYFKKVVDTTKLTTTYRLEGEAPQGATPKTTKFLKKTLK